MSKVNDFYDSASDVISTLFVIALFIGLPIGLIINNNNKVTCTQSSIPYSTTAKYDSNLYTYQSETTTYGKDGTKETCTKNSGNTPVSTKTITAPVNEVVAKGTKTYTITPRYRIGAICSDGTRSYATGSGACSWHGGVSRWLYDE